MFAQSKLTRAPAWSYAQSEWHSGQTLFSGNKRGQTLFILHRHIPEIKRVWSYLIPSGIGGRIPFCAVYTWQPQSGNPKTVRK